MSSKSKSKQELSETNSVSQKTIQDFEEATFDCMYYFCILSNKKFSYFLS